MSTHVSTWSISADRDSRFVAGMMGYMSFANLQSSLPGVSTSRSLALITYKAGPMTDPWIMLAVMDFRVEVSPRYTVQ